MVLLAETDGLTQLGIAFITAIGGILTGAVPVWLTLRHKFKTEIKTFLHDERQTHQEESQKHDSQELELKQCVASLEQQIEQLRGEQMSSEQTQEIKKYLQGLTDQIQSLTATVASLKQRDPGTVFPHPQPCGQEEGGLDSKENAKKKLKDAEEAVWRHIVEMMRGEIPPAYREWIVTDMPKDWTLLVKTAMGIIRVPDCTGIHLNYERDSSKEDYNKLDWKCRDWNWQSATGPGRGKFRVVQYTITGRGHDAKVVATKEKFVYSNDFEHARTEAMIYQKDRLSYEKQVDEEKKKLRDDRLRDGGVAG